MSINQILATALANTRSPRNAPTVLPPVPTIFYTDTPTIPTSGGESGLGGYLSIFGLNFGAQAGMGTTTKVFIGGVEVANYRYLGEATAFRRDSAKNKFGMQQIIVQVGSLGGAATGATLAIEVRVAGLTSNTNWTVKPSGGRVLFCSLSGNNATAAVNNIALPWRHLQQPLGDASIYTSMAAGDQIVIRGGNWNDTTGVDTTWTRFSQGGTPVRRGTANAWIHYTSYPGPINGNAPEDVHYTTPNSATGGIQGGWSATYGNTGSHWCQSNIRYEMSSLSNQDACPTNFQYDEGPVRCVNLEIGPWPAAGAAAKAGGFSGHGRGNQIWGNYVHDIAGTSALENHGVYADTSAFEWDIGYNVIINMTGGSAIQFNDNDGGAGVFALAAGVGGGTWPGFTNMMVHHNWLEVAAKYGINWNDQGGAGGYYSGKCWNNVIIKTGGPPLRRSHGGTGSVTADILFAFNTIYNCSTNSSTFAAAYYSDEWVSNRANINIRMYHNIFAIGPNTEAGTQWASLNESAPGLTWVGNLYWNNAQAPATNTTDTTRVVGSPLFNNVATNDLGLQAGSPALNVAVATLPYSFLVTDDFFLNARPRGASSDIGAIER